MDISLLEKALWRPMLVHVWVWKKLDEKGQKKPKE
jgi:hypothetical protein